MNPYNNALDISNNLDINILNSYMNFVNTTNISFNQILSIINQQQSSFNLLLNQPRSTNNSYLPRQYIPSTRSNNSYLPRQYIPSTRSNNSYLPRQHNPYSRIISPIHRPRGRSSSRNNILVNDIDILSQLLFPSGNDAVNGPSQELIEISIDRKLFEDIEEPLNNSCPITLLDFLDTDNVIQLKQCKHIFSSSSILRWFEGNYHCPLCRKDIRSTDGNNEMDIDPTTGNTDNTTSNTTGNTDTSGNTTSEILSFTQQLANFISNEISQTDISGNFNILFDIDPYM